MIQPIMNTAPNVVIVAPSVKRIAAAVNIRISSVKIFSLE